MANPYDETDNFTSRLKVETTFAPGEVRDHRDGFTQQEYRRNMQETPLNEPAKGFPPMKNVVRPKKKTAKNQSDAALEAANQKDLQNRNLKQ